MSGYVTDANGFQDCVEVNGDQSSIQTTCCSCCERVVILSNDADVVMLLNFFDVFSEMGVEELRVTFGKGENYRVIPIHFLFAKLGQQMCERL